MVVSSYLESFIHLYSYFLYKWAKGLACTKQTADTANFIQEGAEETSGVLKMFLLVNFSISNEKLCGTAHTRLLPRTLFSLRKPISLFPSGEFYVLWVGSAGRMWESHFVSTRFALTGLSVPFFLSFCIWTPVTCLLPPHGSKYNVCHTVAVYPVFANVPLPWREMCGNPATSLALVMIICNHSNIPAKKLHNIHLQSSHAAVCEDHSSSFNYYHKSLKTFY